MKIDRPKNIHIRIQFKFSKKAKIYIGAFKYPWMIGLEPGEHPFEQFVSFQHLERYFPRKTVFQLRVFWFAIGMVYDWHPEEIAA